MPRSTSPQRIVYVLRSVNNRTRYYCGSTSNLKFRLAQHNAGECAATKSLRPWELVTAVYFPREASALAFERYLKTGSGRAFAKRHFV
jgi:putative endonuclease